MPHASAGGVTSEAEDGAEGEEAAAKAAKALKMAKASSYEQLDPGCAMAWSGVCTCDPETCRCPTCQQHKKPASG